jgi:GT2 family glycosyltransferase
MRHSTSVAEQLPARDSLQDRVDTLQDSSEIIAREPVAPKTAAMDVVGYVEEVVAGPDGPVLKGWAFDRANPAVHVALVTCIDQWTSATFTCDIPRPDLALAGFPRTDCGFLWPVPGTLHEARAQQRDSVAPEMFGVRASDGSELVLLQPMQAYAPVWLWQPPKRKPRRAPVIATPEALMPEAGPVTAPAIAGFVEEVVQGPKGSALKGWAFDPANPKLPVILQVHIGDRTLPEITANLPRPDLETSGFPRTDCGFLWIIPKPLADRHPKPFSVRTRNGAKLQLLLPPENYAALWEPPPVPPQSPLFDPIYYSEENGDGFDDGETPWEHFLRIGAAEMRNPSPLFDIRYYREVNPGLEDLDENPLLHFDRTGRGQGLACHWLISEAEYKDLNPELPTGIDGLQHLLVYGLRENRPVSRFFNANYYLSRSPDFAKAGVPALIHFLKLGDKEGRAPHPLFDPSYYQASAGHLGGMGVLEHFIRVGRDAKPHPLFDVEYYTSRYHIAGNGMVALLHYMTEGAARGYDPHPLFQTAHYLGVSPEPEARANPLAHYVTAGQQLGRSPHPLFLPHFYAEQPVRRSWNGRTLPLTGPLISVIVPVYNTPPKVLVECIESVLRQTYASWELCIVDDGSRNPGTASTLATYRNRDPRIRIDRTTANLHIARATNRAAMQASGEFLAFLDHDDVLEPEALAEVAAALQEFPDIDMLYTDEDKLDANGNRTEPYYKPDWSPEHLQSVMYVLHMLTVRKSLFWAVGGSRPERTGAQDFDLALRVARKARRVHHIPRILYHWRMMAGSAAGDLEAKPYAIEAGRAALQDAVDAEGLEATVVPGLLQGTFRVRPRLTPPPPVSLLILTHDIERDVEGRCPMNLVRNFVTSIAEKSTYQNYRIVIVDDANSSAETKKLAKQVGASIVSYKAKGPFSYARKANFATSIAETEHIVHLNDDMEVISPEWIEALLELSTRTDIGGVGGRLLYPNGRIQHAGVILGVHGATGHAFHNLERDVVGYNAYTHLIRNYSAITGAVFASRKSVLDEVGGYDESLAIDFNDIDLCLRIGQSGRRIVYTPYCELFHFEGSSAKRTEANPIERSLFLERWSGIVAHDPYYNPNLPRDRLGFA